MICGESLAPSLSAVRLSSAHPEKKTGTCKFPIQKREIFCKVKEIKELGGGVR